MPRFKQTFSGSLKFKAEPEYPISQYEINLLRARPFDELAAIEDCKNGELTLKAPGTRTLAQELDAGVDGARLADVTRQTLQLAELLLRADLAVERVVLAPQLIYAAPGGGGLKFIYLPVNGAPFRYDLVLFLKELIQRARLSGTARDRWNTWARALSGPKNWARWMQTIPRDSAPGAPAEAGEDEAATSLDPGESIGPLFEADVKQPSGEEDEAATGLDEGSSIREAWMQSGPAAGPDDDGEAPTGLDDDQMIDFMDQADGTFSESLSEWTSHAAARLVPLEGGAEVPISKNSFKLGRSAQRADYCIANNSVSNVHATILKNGSEFFIKDNGSTNGTYLNDRKLEPTQGPVHLKNGDIIRLWNLEYRFVLK